MEECERVKEQVCATAGDLFHEVKTPVLIGGARGALFRTAHLCARSDVADGPRVHRMVRGDTDLVKFAKSVDMLWWTVRECTDGPPEYN